jgi:hypothetical protein
MKQQEAKRLIIKEWDRLVRQQSVDSDRATGRDTLKFYVELEDARSPLLNFPTRGRDKWQIVHDWLVGSGRIR